MITASKAMIGYGLAVAGLYTGHTVIDIVAPPGMWLEVQSVKIRDTTEGVSPTMVVFRTIRKPFYGEWKAEVERMLPGGTFIMICQANGSNNYSPLNTLPENLDLDWWTYPTKCNLKVGKYRVETVWRVFPSGITPREIHYISNVFEVKGTPQ